MKEKRHRVFTAVGIDVAMQPSSNILEERLADMAQPFVLSNRPGKPTTCQVALPGEIELVNMMHGHLGSFPSFRSLQVPRLNRVDLWKVPARSFDV